MDLTHVSLIVLTCLLTGGSSQWSRPNLFLASLGSVFKQEACSGLSGGNLIKIATHQCQASNGKRQCKAKCNGLSTREPKASKE
ncbi:hypothetical protein OS493_004273 [Desmophyllum pertusum]|uniref:Secreted protein n=1 Tax=Desmophyllum pertusum TaxID=174260 RepID=A0A9W9ZUE7_9CNID|nr:hypothetical protein OS493_004273 [Desmophyllum pertusum]